MLREDLQSNFLIGQLADDLLDFSILICGKREDKKSRFPSQFYSNYVDRIMNTVLDIHEGIFIANEIRNKDERKSLQKTSMAKCIYLNHLVRVARNKSWISEKQLDTWQSKVTALRWKINSWVKSDLKRF